MAKRIERSRIESGRVELPRKLAFLLEQKVDFLSLTDRDGDYTVEVSADVLKKLVKAKADLKAHKTDQKRASSEQKAELDAERAAHEETRAALTKAERRVKSLEKRLASGSTEGADQTPTSRAGRKSAVEPQPESQPQAELESESASEAESETQSDAAEAGDADAEVVTH
ncbi:MAG TPA: hypothetical protein VFP68_22955 [Burkholderiaceae bacterium]|nr:hypothetical protein [Burkholderiaceae bacterium]